MYAGKTITKAVQKALKEVELQVAQYFNEHPDLERKAVSIRGF
jgi:hypothetical protein